MIAPTRRKILAGALGGAAMAPLSGCSNPPEGKLALWDNATGPHLRGSVVVQRRVYPELDGPEFMGRGVVGTPVGDDALAALKAAGANLLILSHPGPFTETPPYQPDLAIEDHLNDLVRRCELAGLYVVIGFRSGPGRSEFTFQRGAAGTWFPAERINDTVWTSYEAWDGWDAMWRRVAARFRNRTNVAGYLLMAEPNANQAAPGPDGGDLDEWDPQRLIDTVSGTAANWPYLAGRLARAIREHDAETPILVSPDGYANTAFEPLLDLNAAPGQVLCVHDYTPRAYTHQDRGAQIAFARGEAAFEPPSFDRWMMGETGLVRWAPGATRWLRERVRSLERAGAGWAWFRWDTGWRVYEARENSMNPLYGSDPDAVEPDPDSALLAALQSAWRRNAAAPQSRLTP